ncbi:MAG: hypothetical protein H6R10_2682 [Rhodocyclaceae bacterium]|nr:hypothetical protein [Rhodocyclaceae bacterium]
MKPFLVIAFSAACGGLAHAVEYGSVTIPGGDNPGVRIERFSRGLCEKAGAEAKVSSQANERIDVIHIACESSGMKTGDIFARQADGRVDINYRLE